MKNSVLNPGSDDIVAAPHVAKGRRPEVECGEGVDKIRSCGSSVRTFSLYSVTATAVMSSDI